MYHFLASRMMGSIIIFKIFKGTRGFPRGTVVKKPPVNTGDAGDMGLIPRLGRSPGGGNGNPLQYFLPGESHGQRSLTGYSPRGCKELDMTE